MIMMMIKRICNWKESNMHENWKLYSTILIATMIPNMKCTPTPAKNTHTNTFAYVNLNKQFTMNDCLCKLEVLSTFSFAISCPLLKLKKNKIAVIAKLSRRITAVWLAAWLNYTAANLLLGVLFVGENILVHSLLLPSLSLYFPISISHSSPCTTNGDLLWKGRNMEDMFASPSMFFMQLQHDFDPQLYISK